MTKKNGISESNSVSAGQRTSVARGYFLAAFCLAIAFGLRWVLDPFWGDRVPYVSFVLAQLIVMRWVGGGPLTFTAVAGFFLADWSFVAPRHSLLITGPVNQVSAVFYWLISAVLLFLSVRERRILARERLAQEELQRKTEELQAALNNIKTLRGLLPICASCKKIRDDNGYWNQIEVYIREHSDADFTHGICPECAQKFYGDLLKLDSPKPVA